MLCSTSLMGQTGPSPSSPASATWPPPCRLLRDHRLARPAAGRAVPRLHRLLSPRASPPLAALAAVDHARRTGEGQYLDFSQAEAALHLLAPALLDWR